MLWFCQVLQSKMTNKHWIIYAFLWLIVDVRANEVCPDGQYLYMESHCKECSEQCPQNQRMVQPCSAYSDLLCQSNAGHFSYLPHEALYSHSNALKKSSSDPKDESEKNNGKQVSSNDSSSGKKQTSSDWIEKKSELPVEKHGWQHCDWKALAIALIVLLAILIILAAVVVVVGCFKLKRSILPKSQEEEDADDADSVYVVIRTIRDGVQQTEDQATNSSHLDSQEDPSASSTPPPLPPPFSFLPRTYTPQRRLLNYTADDVFESDDQSYAHIGAASSLQENSNQHDSPSPAEIGSTVLCKKSQNKQRRWFKQKRKANPGSCEEVSLVGCLKN